MKENNFINEMQENIEVVILVNEACVAADIDSSLKNLKTDLTK
ncbi:MAG: hypothetical protein R3Y06_12230 [Faecalibacterium sp.]